MKIKLVDTNPDMVSTWKNEFKNFPEIEIYHKPAFSIEMDAIVSPSNSRGFLDGGFDAVITDVLGPQVQINLQNKIKEEYNGELLVGQACFIETNNKKVPYCISAPTMRVPMFLGQKSVNAYLASRAIFLLLKQENLPFKSVVIPGLGTGVGRIPHNVCAHQMRMAYEEFYLGKWNEPASWRDAQIEHQKLFTFNTVEFADIQFNKPPDIDFNQL